jgi:D-aspartate ligase
VNIADTSTPVVVLDPVDCAHTIARSLGRLGIRVWGVHGDVHASGSRSRYWAGHSIRDVAKGPAPESIEWLRGLAARFDRRPILVPTDDTSALFVADHVDELSVHFVFPRIAAGLARSLSSKRGMYDLCRQHNVPTAETLFPESRDDVIEALDAIRFPVMIKGIYTYALQDRAGVRMLEIHDAKALLEQYDRMETPGKPNVMIQEFIPAESEDNWMFDGCFGEDSSCLFGLIGQKLRQYPPYRGRTSLGVVRHNPELLTQIERFVRAVGFRGVLDMGYRYDARTDEYKLLDVNPRVGMTFRLFVDRSGLDVVRALYLSLTGQPLSAGERPEGRKWVAEDIDLVSSFVYLRDRNVGVGELIRSFRGVEEGCWFALDDPAPLVARSVQAVSGVVGDLSAAAVWVAGKLPSRRAVREAV